MRFILCGIDDRGVFGLVLCGAEPGGQEKVIAADWIVIPRARSAGRKSVTVLPSSTSIKRSQ